MNLERAFKHYEHERADLGMEMIDEFRRANGVEYRYCLLNRIDDIQQIPHDLFH